MTVEYKFKKQIGRRGFYCLIRLEVFLTEKQSLILEYIPDHHHELKLMSTWHSPIEFAVNYFYESYSIDHKRGLRVVIREVHSMIIDTSSMVVFYTTLKALYKALDIPDDRLVNINDEGIFTFPKILYC
jgi:hypothetical protein